MRLRELGGPVFGLRIFAYQMSFFVSMPWKFKQIHSVASRQIDLRSEPADRMSVVPTSMRGR